MVCKEKLMRDKIKKLMAVYEKKEAIEIEEMQIHFEA